MPPSSRTPIISVAPPGLPPAEELVEAVRKNGPGILDSIPGIDDVLLNVKGTAAWINKKPATIYRFRKNPPHGAKPWPPSDLPSDDGSHIAWTPRTVVLHRAGLPGEGAPGQVRRRRGAPRQEGEPLRIRLLRALDGAAGSLTTRDLAGLVGTANPGPSLKALSVAGHARVTGTALAGHGPWTVNKWRITAAGRRALKDYDSREKDTAGGSGPGTAEPTAIRLLRALNENGQMTTRELTGVAGVRTARPALSAMEAKSHVRRGPGRQQGGILWQITEDGRSFLDAYGGSGAAGIQPPPA